MNLEVTIAAEGSGPRRQSLGPGEHLVGSSDAEIQLSYPTVSRAHGRILVAEGLVTYFDLSSRNGSILLEGGRESAVSPGIATIWGRGSTLRVGPFSLTWQPAEGAGVTAAPAGRADGRRC